MPPLRAQKADSDLDASMSDPSSSRPSSPGLDQPQSSSGDEETSDVEESPSDLSEEDEDNDIQENLREISFGALAEAQDSLPSHQRATNHDRNRKLPSADPSTSRTDAEKVSLLRSRLAELKSLKERRKTSSADNASKSLNSTSSSTRPTARSSKHAPTEQTSRRAVTRARPAVSVPQNPYHSRDPRFDSLSTGVAAPYSDILNKKYAFLAQYRESELSTLKSALSALKKKKHPTQAEEEEIEKLKRGVNSLENKIKSDKGKEREKEIVRRHRKEEREKVKSGKTPFFLKRSELKKRSETERFDGMKAKEREKIMDRRKKKLEQREKKAMPRNRRVVG